MWEGLGQGTRPIRCDLFSAGLASRGQGLGGLCSLLIPSDWKGALHDTGTHLLNERVVL